MTQASARILVVDDDQRTLDMLLAGLGRAGYTCVPAESAEKAARLLEDDRFDLVLLDVNMPEMDGYDVCRELRKNPVTADIRIIMLTAMAQDFDRRKAIEAGANEYMTKPFSPTALLERVEEVLGTGGESGAGESGKRLFDAGYLRNGLQEDPAT